MMYDHDIVYLVMCTVYHSAVTEGQFLHNFTPDRIIPACQTCYKSQKVYFVVAIGGQVYVTCTEYSLSSKQVEVLSFVCLKSALSPYLFHLLNRLNQLNLQLLSRSN